MSRKGTAVRTLVGLALVFVGPALATPDAQTQYAVSSAPQSHAGSRITEIPRLRLGMALGRAAAAQDDTGPAEQVDDEDAPPQPGGPPEARPPRPGPCATVPLPSSVAAGPVYPGPLFDTHIHMSPLLPSFGSAERLCEFFAARQVLWAIAFFAFGPLEGPIITRARPYMDGARARVVPLLQPTALSPGGPYAALAEGAYTSELLSRYLRPAGPLAGVGEIALYFPELQPVRVEHAQMQQVLRTVNDINGIVMIHPWGSAERGVAQSPAEMEPSIRRYPNVRFLFHGSMYVFDRFVQPVMARYPNVYWTWDVGQWLGVAAPALGEIYWDHQRTGTAEAFVAEFERVGLDRIVESNLSAFPKLEPFADRVLWGTDLVQPWQLEDGVMSRLIELTRRYIGGMPPGMQEDYAYRNALRILGPYLDPPP